MMTEATFTGKARGARRPLLGAIIAIAVTIGALPLANAGWDGNIAIQLGESFAAEFVGDPGAEVHRFYFYAPAGTILGATPKTTFGNLVTNVAVFRGDDTLVPLGLTLNAKTKAIKNLILTVSDDYYIQVKSTSGKGEYLIKTTAKFPSSFKVTLPAAGTTSFAAIAGASLSATVAKAKGSSANPSFNELQGPNGQVALPAMAAVKPPKTPTRPKLSKLLLPSNGVYTLGVEYLPLTITVPPTAPGTGAVSISASIASPKARHVWYLGPINPPTVILSVDSELISEAAGVATFTASLSAASGLPVTVDLAFSGTATLTADYTRSATQIVIPAGSTSGSIVVTAVQDALKEADETVVVDISAVTNASENGVQQQSTSILDDDVAPQVALWQGSGHAAAASEAFRHWDNDADKMVDQDCARCHSGAGFQDFIGADGTADNRADHRAAVNGVVPPARADGPAAPSNGIDCSACHNETAAQLDAVFFPSERAARPSMAMDLGPEARCMQCHQGRESTVSLDEYIASKAPANDDDSTKGLSFKNIHYLSAAATLYGGGAKGAYQYKDGLTAEDGGHLYDGLNPHVPEANTCVECHNPHSLEVEIALCAQCHVTGTKAAVASVDDLKNIRMIGSPTDYDGDGNVTEGMYYELSTMAATLYTAIQAYATNQGAPIVYDPNVYPYFAKATGGSYTSWTPRLLRAAYNYNDYVKEPGTYAHNPKYMIQILFDSIEDLAAGGVSVPALASMHRSDTGHFDGQAMPFRDWDVRTISGVEVDATNDIVRADVPVSCSPCHTNSGFEFWQKYGLNTTVEMPAADGMECGTCHVGGTGATGFGAAVPALKVVKTVTFPSLVQTPVTITNSTTSPDTSFICMSCHRGRESMATLDADIASRAAQNPPLAPRFRNIHYLPAGASIYGRDAKVAYMFGDSTTYAAKWAHAGGTTAQCKFCHLPDHTFEPELKDNCLGCHVELEAGDDVEGIRKDRGVDYNGVNGTSDTLKEEVASFAEALFAQMNVYAAAQVPALDPIIYDAHTNPYFFKSVGVTYTTWTPTLVRAAFNYQYSQKEPGAWAHNTKFVLQVLYDSIDILDDGVLNSSPTTTRNPALIRP